LTVYGLLFIIAGNILLIVIAILRQQAFYGPVFKIFIYITGVAICA